MTTSISDILNKKICGNECSKTAILNTRPISRHDFHACGKSGV